MTSSLQQAEHALIVQIEPWVDAMELQQLRRVIDSTFLVEHELTREFESWTARYTGAKHAVAVCNGSMALFTCLKVLGIGPGDEVIVPNLTFIASANAVILAGATPVLCEVREDTFCIDVARAEELVTSRTRAVMPVHLYGQSADLDAVTAFARRHGLKVVEDAAEGIGVRYDGQHVGTVGDMGIISYYGNKTVTCGEGGIILTNDDDLARAAFRMKNYGRDQKGVYSHDTIGFNFSFTDLQAAIGIAQMKKLPAIISKKEAVHKRYVRDLRPLATFCPVYIDPKCEPVFWFSSFLCECPEALATYLRARGVQTRRLFLPLHQQPCYADGKHVRMPRPDFRISESIHQRGISLPSSYSLTDDQQSYVIEQIHRFYAGRD
jgi:perosamine synthetase